MKVEIWDGGLQEQEVTAIEKIKEAFSAEPSKQKQSPARGGSLQDQLKSTGLAGSGMFPWKGYAGFRFVDSKGKEGEFDLVIVTHCNVLIIELKDWNHAPITAVGDTWYKGEQNMGRSPVSVTRSKMFTLKKKLSKLKHRFSNQGFVPFVEFFVVVTGDADISGLEGEQRKHTLTLTEFLKFGNQDYFEKQFAIRHSKQRLLNKDFHLFDDLFGSNKTSPKTLRVAGFEAKEKIFDHPKNVYKEYLAQPEISSSSEALLRIWNFSNIEGTKAHTPEGRAHIVSREQEILQRIRHQNLDLYNHCLRSLTSFQKDEVTAGYSEVYELPPGHVRFNEFVGKYGKGFSEQDRLNVTKLLLAKFSDLHQAKIAHRDIADHSLWISPSKAVALSNFISAYHQPIGTVGDYRKSLSVGAIEATEMLNDDKHTPFQQDVHALGLVAWHLLSGERMSPKSMANIQEDMLSCDEWYAGVLLDAVAASYSSATEFFDALKNAEPAGKIIPTFDDSELETYRHPINHSRQYREDDDFIIESEEKEVYVSNGCLVKAWLNTGAIGDSDASNFRVLRFLKLLDKLSAVNPSFLPAIRAYGVATKSSALYLVTDKVEGKCWSEIAIPEEGREALISRFIASVEQLHELGIAHGDIHPANVMVGDDHQSLYLIDLPDYSASGEQKNHLYSPEYIDNCTAFERDNFAVMKMSCELLGIPWGESDDKFPAITKAVLEELEDKEFGFKDLGRFKLSFQKQQTNVEQETIEVKAGDAPDAISILPDNGKLFVKVEPNPKESSEVRVTLTGIGGCFSALYKHTEQRFVVGFKPRERSSISKRDEEQSNFEIGHAIRVRPGRPQDLNELTNFFKDNEDFRKALDAALTPPTVEEDAPTGEQLTQGLKEAFARLGQQERVSATREIEISTIDLWKAILNTETESNPNIELIGNPIAVPESKSELILPYTSDVDPLDTFGRTDEVDALLIDDEDNEKVLGHVCLKSSALNEVKIVNTRSLANRLNDGDIVYFRSKQDRASYRKRKAALERILSRSCVTPELVELFDPSCQREPTDYGISVTEEDFKRYDRKDQHDKLISLNQQQREAFSKLVNFGPLSLLQGPPGTGKTEFIAAFVHYLVEKQNTKRILLVSQSHEAVNTAAERIRKHCSRLKTELEVVRFSNREGAVSIGLKDVYSQAITTEKRELFNAEIKYRVQALSDALGLDAKFISDVVLAELQLFQQIDQLSSLLSQLDKTSDEKDIVQFKGLCVELDQSIRDTLLNKYGFELADEEPVLKAKEEIIAKLCREYSVRPDEARRVRALATITRDMQNALSGERVNIDEFYARSRQLVTGTCVGIGQGHIGINQNVYDWVIIDEAARSISSELAIAMQSAKRILLVGDHLQLPPLYSDAHKAALAKKLGISGSRADLDEVLRSDFARAFNSEYGQGASAALLTQYRMADPIGNLVSQTFYEGKLQNPAKEDQRTVPDFYLKGPKQIRNTVTWLDTSELGTKAEHDDDRGSSIYNRCEAEQVIALLKQVSDQDELVSDLAGIVGKNEAPIGVICMYAEQKRILRKMFNQELWPDGFRELVKIDTVDSYQGKENRIIILSITRSDKRQSPGFLRMPNRINVAMSRAMDRLLIVGDSTMWKGKNKDLPLGRVFEYMSEHGESAGYAFVAAKKGGKRA